MQSFVHFFPLLVGHLVPENDQYWLFLINFIELIDFLLLSKFNDLDLSKLNTCIAYHSYKYVELFNDTLKPKHHLYIYIVQFLIVITFTKLIISFHILHKIILY